MDDQEALRQTRDKFVAERDKLNMMIALLSEQLGEQPPVEVDDVRPDEYEIPEGSTR